MSNKLASLALVIFTAITLTPSARSQTKTEITEDLMKEQVNGAPCKNEDRLEAAKKLFRDAGATDVDMEVQKFRDVNNLVVTKKGKTADTVVISAHYDKVKDGCGAIDNWTGVVIISDLYRRMRGVETSKTYLFVAFDKEELGLLGSEAMSKAIPKENRANYCSNVNLDSFGFSYPQVLDNASSPKMTEMAKSVADEVKMPFTHTSLEGVADADSSSFKSRDIPAVTFHGLNKDWQKYLHSSNDLVKNINISSVFVGYNFLLRYVVKIDGNDCGIFRKSGK
jgi:Zn-dependent M28 family amino/carboxypeptidase